MIEVNIKLPRKNFEVIIKDTFINGITGIYGPSGSGKTSLLHCIAGLEKPAEGYISVNGRNIFHSQSKINLPVEKRNIGYVFQEGRLFPHFTAEKNLTYGIKKGVSKVSFDEVVDLLNLRQLLKSKPSQMSGGERQRTALGRSLLSSPDILLLDEPFSAVDTRLREQILPFILRIQQKVQIPILVVSHDIPDLLRLTNNLFLIKDGKCLGHGEYYDLLKLPAIDGIFGSGSIVNSIEMKVTQVKSDMGLTVLSHGNTWQQMFVKCEKTKETYQVGQTLKIFINADDIALSTEKIQNVTIQNQIKGTVVEVIDSGSSRLCIIDAGFRLVVEITAESLMRMQIIKGSLVYCLFKSVAIDVAG